MRINELESDNKYILTAIEKDCQPFLNRIGKDIGNYPMFRGMEFHKNADNLIRKKVHLDDRTPMSSAKIKHDRYNAWFEDIFGEPFRNALFVSGGRDVARSYGEPFVVFPIGHFDWVWSTQVGDMAIDIRWPNMGGFINVPPNQEVVNSTLDNLDYNLNHDLKGAIKSSNEIMIRCEEYYAVKYKAFRELTD